MITQAKIPKTYTKLELEQKLATYQEAYKYGHQKLENAENKIIELTTKKQNLKARNIILANKHEKKTFKLQQERNTRGLNLDTIRADRAENEIRNLKIELEQLNVAKKEKIILKMIFAGAATYMIYNNPAILLEFLAILDSNALLTTVMPYATELAEIMGYAVALYGFVAFVKLPLMLIQELGDMVRDTIASYKFCFTLLLLATTAYAAYSNPNKVMDLIELVNLAVSNATEPDLAFSYSPPIIV